MVSYKLPGGISPNLQVCCTWRKGWTD